MEEKLYDAAESSDVQDVKDVLRNNPNLNVNWSNEIDEGSTALIIACDNGHDSIVSILLTHPDIDVNQKDLNGWTPFNCACFAGSTSCVRLLLNDSRVTLNQTTEYGNTPLYWAARQGHLDVVRWWIASGREMDLGEPGNDKTDAILKSKNVEETEVVALLERFKENPVECRHQVRLELGLIDELAAEIFAIVVFVSDGLLQVTQGDGSTSAAVRFFALASRLPLELQMVLCYCLVGSCKEIIPGRECEMAFRELARRM